MSTIRFQNVHFDKVYKKSKIYPYNPEYQVLI